MVMLKVHHLTLLLPLIGDAVKAGGRGCDTGRDDPITFPNCRYSFSNPPPFTGDPPGPKIYLRNPNAYIFFSLY